ncbi:alpha/beta fold hydrolase [Nesterenkonia muleiensis]|uniref:alpha/beta fold hydrolase n=1 Tax=Nesterenkonia muleiensis TaxID=2282648 RepID=UPI001EE4BEC5|nr:alpha/beta fold hydrolase [Nesterenkonia muleiensis]
MKSSEIRASGLLAAGNGHQLYWEESGNPDGIPALYLHGGPGGTLGSGGYRNKFDLEDVRLIGMDQRGCGRSTPPASAPGYDLAENTTQHLLADIEALRTHVGIEAWLLNGVSWGSTLAIAYAQAFPHRTLGIVLMAVTTTSRFEVEWITETVGNLFPEAWDRFAAHAENAEIGYRRGQGRLVEAYLKLLRDPDPDVRDAASRQWALWEDTHISLGTGGIIRDPRWDDGAFRATFCTLAAHYWSNLGFMDPPILARMDRLRGIPATLIHGRRDVSGPVRTAWELHQTWPGTELIIDEGEGHGGTGMVDQWRAANSRHVQRLISQGR